MVAFCDALPSGCCATSFAIACTWLAPVVLHLVAELPHRTQSCPNELEGLEHCGSLEAKRGLEAVDFRCQIFLLQDLRDDARRLADLLALVVLQEGLATLGGELQQHIGKLLGVAPEPRAICSH